MIVSIWNATVLSLFAVQYSYNVSHTNIDRDHIRIENGTLVSCIYPWDLSFKEKSDTLPRSELRLLEERVDGVYKVAVNVSEVPPLDTEFSVWQIFARSPLFMMRRRGGSFQMVTFKGKPKIINVPRILGECEVKCGVGGYVRCDEFVSWGTMRCKNSLHVKVGIYAQGTQPFKEMCGKYNEFSITSVS